MKARTVFANQKFYHIYNIGIEKRIVFENQYDIQRFLNTLVYYTNKKQKPRFSFRNRETAKKENAVSSSDLVEIIAYCLMPNHFHLLLKQVSGGGISNFLSKVTNSYTKYFNKKHRRSGPLFQGTFKAVQVNSNEELASLSRFIHLNPLVGSIVKDLSKFPFSSFLEYTNSSEGSFCKKEYILKRFKNPQEYGQFVLNTDDYEKSIKGVEKQLLDWII